MYRQEFINRLSALLRDLPPQERDKAIAYYLEIISDKIESGQNEATVIAEFGDLQTLANNILADSPYVKRKKITSNPVFIVLLCIFSPAIFGLFMAFFGVAISLTAAAFALVFSFFAVSVSLALAGVILFFGSFILMPTNVLLAILQIGMSLVLVGISIFIFMGSYYFTKVVAKFVGSIFNSLKNVFRKRGVRYEK